MNIRHILMALAASLALVGSFLKADKGILALSSLTDAKRIDTMLVLCVSMDVGRLVWTDGMGEHHVLEAIEGRWYYAGMEAIDSISFDQYLRSLSISRRMYIETKVDTSGLLLKEKIVLERKGGDRPVTLMAFHNADPHFPFLIHSSDHPGLFFLSDNAGLYKEIFGDLRTFWP